MDSEYIFKNERLTYRLNIIAQEAILANDEIFLQKTGCRIRDLRVLRLIDDNPGTTFAEIAKITGFERSLTSRIIQSLISNELIERKNSPDDARVFMLSTTEKGKSTRLIGRQVSDQLEVILTDPLSTQEMRALNEILARLGNWVVSDDYRNAIKDDTQKDFK